MSFLTKSLFITLTALSLNAQAGVLNGDTVSFQYDDALLGLFGAPSVSGDSIFFTPTNFKIRANDAHGANSIDSTIALNISTLAGIKSNITGVNLTEKGTYKQLNVRPNVASEAGVLVEGQIQAVDIASLNSISSSLNVPDLVDTQKGKLGNWQGTASLNLSTFSTSSIVLSIENLLTAYGYASGDQAFVEKKYVGLSVATAPVPLPSAVWMFGAALFGFLSISKRKNQL